MINLKKLTEKLWLQSVHNFGAVIGEIRWFAMSTPPEGYLPCNGAAVGRATYPELFATIGTTYGSGDGSTTFNLPNLMGKVPWGSTDVGTVLNAGLPNITGYVEIILSNTRSNGAASGAFTKTRTSSGANYSGAGNGSENTLDFNASRSNSIYGRSDTVQPPALCLLPCIRYE